MTLSNNISFHPFGEIHWWTSLNKTVSFSKMLRKTSSNILKSSKSSFLYVPSSSKVSFKKLALQRRLWKNVSFEDLILKEIKKYSLKSLFAITFKCSRESWFPRTKNFKLKLWKKSEKKVIILLISAKTEDKVQDQID